MAIREAGGGEQSTSRALIDPSGCQMDSHGHGDASLVDSFRDSARSTLGFCFVAPFVVSRDLHRFFGSLFELLFLTKKFRKDQQLIVLRKEI